MLLPSGGPKGFGLAFLIDLLCGLLGRRSGGAVQPLYGDAAIPYDCSHLFIAIDVAHFGDPATVRAAALRPPTASAPDNARPVSPSCLRRVSRNGASGKARRVRSADASSGRMLTRMARELRVSAMPIARDDEPSIQEPGHAQA